MRCKLRDADAFKHHANRKILVEVAAHIVEAALAAEAGGADRVELFSNHLEGGVTPSEGAIAVVRDNVRVDLHVMIRPRAGDFCYSEHELKTMHRDISVAKRLGANGVAFGASIQMAASMCSKLTNSWPLPGRCPLPFIVPLTVPGSAGGSACFDFRESMARAPTSGGMPTAEDGIRDIANLVRIGGNQIRIMAGGGVRPQNVRKIVLQSGVTEVHAGVRSIVSAKCSSAIKRSHHNPSPIPMSELSFRKGTCAAWSSKREFCDTKRGGSAATNFLPSRGGSFPGEVRIHIRQ